MTLLDLHNILSDRIQKLCNDDLAGVDLANELERVNVINNSARELVRADALILNTKKALGQLDDKLVEKITG